MLPDEQALGEASAVETNAAVVDAAVAENTEAERDYEAEAREMGWYPEAEFKGKKRPAEFVDAKTFLERGEHVWPVIKREREKLQKDFEARFSKLEKMSEKTVAKLIEAHEVEIAGLQAKKDAAIEKGDVAGVRKIDAAITKAEANAPTAEPAKDPVADYNEKVATFQEKNSWYGSDDDLTIEAEVYSQRLLKNNPSLDFAENLSKTADYIRNKYPLKFKPDANAHAPVDSPALNGGGGGKDPLSKLSSEERTMAKKDMEKFPKIYPNAAAWLKEYQS